jgi:hypothetical protein
VSECGSGSGRAASQHTATPSVLLNLHGIRHDSDSRREVQEESEDCAHALTSDSKVSE